MHPFHALCHGVQLFMNAFTSFRMRPKLHRCCQFVPLFYPPGMMFEEMHAKTWFALQVRRPSSLPTGRNQADSVNYRRCAKFQALAFDSEITSYSNAMGQTQQQRRLAHETAQHHKWIRLSG